MLCLNCWRKVENGTYDAPYQTYKCRCGVKYTEALLKEANKFYWAIAMLFRLFSVVKLSDGSAGLVQYRIYVKFLNTTLLVHKWFYDWWRSMPWFKKRGY